jgi:hypothetical protein
MAGIRPLQLTRAAVEELVRRRANQSKYTLQQKQEFMAARLREPEPGVVYVDEFNAQKLSSVVDGVTVAAGNQTVWFITKYNRRDRPDSAGI